MASDNARTP